MIPWGLGALRPEFGMEVVNVVSELVRNDPDQIACDQAERERVGERLLAQMAKQQREAYSHVFEEVYTAVCSEETGNTMVRTVKGVRSTVTEPKARWFMQLPQEQAWPLYYQVIEKKNAISISQIAQGMRAGPTESYQDLQEFAKDWRRLFNNARTFNEPNSDIIRHANELQAVFEAKLKESAGKYRVLDGEEL
ncbi:Protein polybromo-1 [Marasmius tenuissimus]|uniref:Protein polybromo-1 n=1 Tax=Marasmius tenuissimus TaxID=585030 RepID=A0ABR2ZC10_9AGAR